ncbi:unnamed protein product, partial [Polarella glacialis]
FGYHLLRLTGADAVFIHESVAPVMEKGLRVRFPQDEFLCYRRSALWMQMPDSYVREWFFADHPSNVFSAIWSNMTSINRESGRPNAPFTLDY